MKTGRILFLQFTNPAMYPPLEHSSRILVEAGWKVLFLGIHGEGSSHHLRLPDLMHRKVWRWNHCPPGFRQKLQYLGFSLASVFVALTWRADWIYASDPMATPAALMLRTLGFHVLYHEHDHPGSRADSFNPLIHSSRALLAQAADLIVLPNEARRDAFNRENGHPDNHLVVWNTPAKGEAEVSPEKMSTPVIVIYQGSIVPERLPLKIVEALARLPSFVRLHIAGYETIGHKGYLDEIRDLAARLGLQDRISYLGSLSRDELLLQTRIAHIGLSLMPKSSKDINMREMVGASNKPFEYLACGCALLVTDLPQWNELFVARYLAISCDPANAGSIGKALGWLIDHPRERQKMGERGRQYIMQEWNYETQFEPVRRQLSAILK